MPSGADLFVVCKQCGSEVSPYITECPYCGSRLRRRAPKLPRVHDPSGGGGRARFGSRRRSPKPGAGAASGGRPRLVADRWAASRPYATMALVTAGCLGWILWHAEPAIYTHMAIAGPLRGEWWKLFTYEFAYFNGLYAFVAIFAIALFGWLLERRHGPVVVLALFFGAGAVGALAALAVYSFPLIVGGNAAALALLAAWAAPDLMAARSGSYYEGDLLGTLAIAALLLAIPFGLSLPEANWLAGVVGGALGLLFGLGVQQRADVEL